MASSVPPAGEESFHIPPQHHPFISLGHAAALAEQEELEGQGLASPGVHSGWTQGTPSKLERPQTKQGIKMTERLLSKEAEKTGQPVGLLVHDHQFKEIRKRKPYGVFVKAYKKLSRAFTSAGGTIADGLVAGGIHTLANGILASVMAKMAAAQAMASMPPDVSGAAAPAGAAGAGGTGGAAPPNVDMSALRYAAMAGVMANAVTIAFALPATVLGVADIVSKTRKAVKLTTQIHKEEGELAKIRESMVERPDDPDLIAEEHRLSESISDAESARKGVGLPIVINSIKASVMAMKTVESALSLAFIGIVASKGTLTVAAQGLQHAAKVLGTMASAVSLGLGGLGLGLNVMGGIKAHRTLTKASAQLQQLESTEVKGEPAITIKNLEVSKLKNQILELKYKRTKFLLSAATNTAMVFSGVVGLVGALGLVTGPGAFILAGVTLGLAGIALAMTVVAWRINKKGKKRLVNEMSVNKLPDVKGAYQAIVDGKKEVTDEQILQLVPKGRKMSEEKQSELFRKFRINPEPFLARRYKGLGMDEIRK